MSNSITLQSIIQLTQTSDGIPDLLKWYVSIKISTVSVWSQVTLKSSMVVCCHLFSTKHFVVGRSSVVTTTLVALLATI